MNEDPNTNIALEAKIDALSAQVELLVARQHRQEAFFEEMAPITREMMGVAIGRLDDLEKRGYFAFGKETLRVLDRVVAGYEPEDVQQLGDNIVGILDTVRNITQPDVLAIANAATNAVHGTDEPEAKGLLGMLRASRDDEVRRGMAVALEVLRQIGRSAERLERRAPVFARPAPTPPRVSAPAPTPIEARPVPEQALVVDGVAFSPEGFLVDVERWTPVLAVAIAHRLGLTLGDQHWAVINFAREDFGDRGKSPNVRRLSKGSGVDIRTLYSLFPKAPGVMVARIAGIPKPAGCI